MIAFIATLGTRCSRDIAGRWGEILGRYDAFIATLGTRCSRDIAGRWGEILGRYDAFIATLGTRCSRDIAGRWGEMTPSVLAFCSVEEESSLLASGHDLSSGKTTLAAFDSLLNFFARREASTS